MPIHIYYVNPYIKSLKMHYLKPVLPFILAVATLASAETTTDTLADNVVNTACTSET